LWRYRLPLVDTAWLAALAIFILAGMMLVTFHGDEAMHIYTSRDYATAFIDHNPASLMVGPPYYIDDDPWLRLLNGSVARYTIGFSWHLAGMNSGMLPPRPGWDWGLDYDRNVETGHRPEYALLQAARFPSTLFLILSAWAMFGIGWQFGGRFPAYLMSGLYTLNPVILLNGRRAIMEGSLLGFGLLTIWLAVLIVRGRDRWYWWVLLTLASGLTLVSKQTGIIFVGGALGWIGMVEIITILAAVLRREGRKSIKRLAFMMVKLTASLIAAVLIFIALSPALWNDPIARFGDLIVEREKLIAIQVALDPNAPTTLSQRIEGIITQPFLTPPMQFEMSSWANAAAITAEIEGYMASRLSGLQFGLVIGLPLTLLAGWGMVIALRKWRSWEIGLLVWFGVTAASLLINPLPWQRYYLPLIPVSTPLAGIGLLAIVRVIQRSTSR
jgi:4-amino-4-deoxy-L-arabinose transferase-like glycosyltransferase